MLTRESFYKVYWKAESIIAPGLKHSQYVYEHVLEENCRSDHVWLDLGCGHQLLPPWQHEAEKSLVAKTKIIVGLDYDHHSLLKHGTIERKVRGDISSLPFSDGSFDLITSNMVFEHLNKPEVQLKEIHRILKPGGRLIFHTPNALSYSTLGARLIPERLKDRAVYLLQGREEEDVFPTFYRINSRARIEKLAQECGYRIKKIAMICSSAQFVMIPPIAILELVWIRILMTQRMRSHRTNIIAVLEKA